MIQRSFCFRLSCMLALFVLYGQGIYSQSLYTPSEQVLSLVRKNFNNTSNSPKDACQAFLAQIDKLNSSNDKKCALYILAMYEESNYLFSDATQHYSQCALLETALEQSQIVKLKASRASILAGDTQLGMYILQTIISNSATFDIKVQAELYMLLSKLVEDDIQASVNSLKQALNDNRFSAYRNILLFSLYWLTSDETVKNTLISDFPYAIETAIVQNKATVSPISFWYLMPRRQVQSISQVAITETVSSETFEVATFYQVGFFQNKINAENLQAELVRKGFVASVKLDMRNGTTMYQVLVTETEKGETGQSLKKSGYEAYPVFN